MHLITALDLSLSMSVVSPSEEEILFGKVTL
jgi:hypothetical protein